MAIPNPVQFLGNPGSPYTRKMLALLRYRRIPHTPIWKDPGNLDPTNPLEKMGIEKPKPVLLPTFLLPDESTGEMKAVCDSTPIIRRLEQEVEGRNVIPPDPAMSFINFLLEDFGDEWCTKYMFHYRWHFEADIDNAGTLLPLGMNISLKPEDLEMMKEYISKRQIERLYVVGSNNETAPIIDASYKRFLQAMEKHLQNVPFLLGSRPSSSDFAIYGQLTQLVGFDPTPRKIALEVSPRTVVWVSLIEDQSGLEISNEDWQSLSDAKTSLKEILDEVGKVYVPALLANSLAVNNNQDSWETQIDGASWQQPTFKYQAKCLEWIKDEYAKLPEESKAEVDDLLSGTGCEALFF